MTEEAGGNDSIKHVREFCMSIRLIPTDVPHVIGNELFNIRECGWEK